MAASQSSARRDSSGRPLFILSLRYLNWLTWRKGPKLAEQIKIQLMCISVLLKEADGRSPAGNDCAEIIILHFTMTYQAPRPGEEGEEEEKNSDSASLPPGERIDEEN